MNKFKLLIIILVLVFLFSLVDIFGLALTPPGFVYYHPDTDINVYYTYMDQAREGRFWFCNQFAVEEHQCKLFFPLWYAAGRLGETFNISNFVSLILIRIIILLILFYVFFAFCKKLFPAHKLTVFLLGVFSGGVFLYYLHSNIFTISLQNPLNALVCILLILILWLTIECFENRISVWRGIGLFVLCWLLVMLHTYEAIILIINSSTLILLSAFFSYKRFIKSIKIFIIVSLGSVLGLLYYLHLFLTSEAYGGWLVNNYLPLFSTLSIIFNFGLLLPFSLLGAYLIMKNRVKINQWAVILSWLMGGWAAIILPLYVNSKFLLSWYLGSIFVTIYLVIYLIKKQLFHRYNKVVIVSILFILILGNMRFYFGELSSIFKVGYPRYLPQEYIKPLDWLKENSGLDESLIGSARWDTFIASHSGLRTFIGSNQVYQRELKMNLVDWFYSDNSQDPEKQQFLKDYNIYYVYYSPVEKEKGSYDPESKDYLEKVYNDGWARIFKVK